MSRRLTVSSQNGMEAVWRRGTWGSVWRLCLLGNGVLSICGSTLKMEAKCFSETSVPVYKITRRHIQESPNLDVKFASKISCWTGYLSWYSDLLRAGGSGNRISVGARFFAHIQTGPGALPASCTKGTVSFPGVKRPGRVVKHPPPSNADVKE